MAYVHARSNVCYAGVTHAGLVTRSLSMTIGGSASTPQAESIRITEQLDAGQNRMTFVVQGVSAVPTRFASVVLGYSNIDNLRFAGTLLEVERVLKGFESGISDIEYHCVAADLTWKLNLTSRVTKRYFSQPVNGIVADLLRTYTDAAYGFAPGYIPDTLAALDIEFTGETVLNALTRIAKASSAYLWVDYDSKINIATSLPDGNTLTIANTTNGIEQLRYTQDGSQIRTTVQGEGGGSETAEDVSAGATTVPVNQTSWYSSSGGKVRANNAEFAYTGKSTESGAGSLTGVTVPVDLPVNTAVNLVVEVTDSAAKTAFASAIGGGAGVALHQLQDNRLSAGEMAGRVATELAFFSSEISSARALWRHEFVRPGKTLTMSLTSQPETISATLLIQSTTTKFREPVISGNVVMEVEFQAQKYRKTLHDLLAEGQV